MSRMRREALCKSVSSILSSGLTTVIGFLALLFMRFGIGPDLGSALAKGIAISLLTVFLFMPGVILITYKWLDRTSHRKFTPSFEKFGTVVRKVTLPLTAVFCVLIIPCFYLSSHNSYYYGSSHIFSEGTQYGDDTAFIEDTFGIKDTYVLMVPQGSDKTERALGKSLEQMDDVVSITSLTNMLGPAIPLEIVPEKIKKKLRSDEYSRMVLSVGVPYEGDETFALVEKIRSTAGKYYGDSYFLAGQGVSTYDLMDTITADMVKVNLVAIGAVFVVLLLTMRSLKNTGRSRSYDRDGNLDQSHGSVSAGTATVLYRLSDHQFYPARRDLHARTTGGETDPFCAADRGKQYFAAAVQCGGYGIPRGSYTAGSFRCVPGVMGCHNNSCRN